MKSLSRWISPLILGVVMFNTIRLITDLPAHNPFWTNSVPFHLLALLVAVIVSYCFDFQSRYYMKKVRAKNFSVTLEYALLLVYLFVCLNLILYLGDSIGILYLGDKVADYVIANVICILYFFLYYIIIRNDKLEKDYNRQSLQLEKIKVDQLEIELKFLRAQYHPHFLFNALNTVYFQIDEKNTLPRNTLEMLSDLLRYQLYGGE
ncbi:MAG: histidine kinase [Parabacteroides sp.]|nr:histidine kinase [Parabacteroides sp.]